MRDRQLQEMDEMKEGEKIKMDWNIKKQRCISMNEDSTVTNTAVALYLPLMLYPTLFSCCIVLYTIRFTYSFCCTGVNMGIKYT